MEIQKTQAGQAVLVDAAKTPVKKGGIDFSRLRKPSKFGKGGQDYSKGARYEMDNLHSEKGA